jgi:hypothetical protein
MSAAAAMDRLAVIDLTMIRLMLAKPEDGQRWAEHELDLGEQEYRRFLALHLMYPEMYVVPCGLVDTVWHAHILDTQAYAADCEKLFGSFLHHFPSVDMGGAPDACDLETAYNATLDRYRAAFGDPPIGTWVAERAASFKRRRIELREGAVRDPLTNLWTREYLAAELAMPTHARTLVVIEVRELSLLNGTLGRSQTDQLLVEIAKRVNAHCRQADVLARLSDAEFAVLLTSRPSRGGSPAYRRRVGGAILN